MVISEKKTHALTENFNNFENAHHRKLFAQKGVRNFNHAIEFFISE